MLSNQQESVEVVVMGGAGGGGGWWWWWSLSSTGRRTLQDNMYTRQGAQVTLTLVVGGVLVVVVGALGTTGRQTLQDTMCNQHGQQEESVVVPLLQRHKTKTHGFLSRVTSEVRGWSK